MSRLLLIVAVVALSACSAHSVPGITVDTLPNLKATATCDFLGQVGAAVKASSYTNPLKTAKREALEKAGMLGSTHVLWKKVEQRDSAGYALVEADAYACPEDDYVERKRVAMRINFELTCPSKKMAFTGVMHQGVENVYKGTACGRMFLCSVYTEKFGLFIKSTNVKVSCRYPELDKEAEPALEPPPEPVEEQAEGGAGASGGGGGQQ